MCGLRKPDYLRLLHVIETGVVSVSLLNLTLMHVEAGCPWILNKGLVASLFCHILELLLDKADLRVRICLFHHSDILCVSSVHSGLDNALSKSVDG